MARKAAQLMTTGLLGASILFAGAGLGPTIGREGDGEHRKAISEIEFLPFDTELLGGLDGWTLGQPLDAQAIEGKVVLIGFVSADEPKSMTILSTLARYQRQNADKGLIVLAVHPDSGWDAMSKKVEGGRVKVQVVRDVGGVLAEGLGVDDAPDVYMIDRAGQLRYGDLDLRSLRSAVVGLVREDADKAIVNAAGERALAESIPEVEPPRVVGPEDYAKAAWPSYNRGTLKAKDYQGKALPISLGSEQWLTEPKELEGKVLVLDFWATWCGPCRRASPMLSQMQKKYEGRLEVLAISGQREDERTVRKYINKSIHSYSHLYDANQRIYRQLEIRAIPHTVIVSSDGVIRWQGNPLLPEFKTSLEKILEIDPMAAPAPEKSVTPSEEKQPGEQDG
jgi:cytochrome c biogenesis protein CcmG, thiol:disulfide interchange protein DsbE